MALFIDLREYPNEGGMNLHFLLTNKYSKEELAKKLQTEYGASKEYLDTVLKEGEVLKEDCVIQIKGTAVLTTERPGSTWSYYPKDEITIHPDGTWSDKKYVPE